MLLPAARDILFFGVIFVFPEIFAAKPSNNLLASVLLDASVQGTPKKQPYRSKMYISAVTVAEFLIVVVIIMSLPKLVTS